MSVDSSPEGLDRLHHLLSRLLGSILHSPELSRSVLELIVENGVGFSAMPEMIRPEQDGHDLLVGAAASVVHDWWMKEDSTHSSPSTEWSDEILDSASKVFECVYTFSETSKASNRNSKDTVASVRLGKPLGIGLTPDGTVLRTTPGGQGELNGVLVGSQVIRVDAQPVANLNDLKEALAASRRVEGKTVVQVVFTSPADPSKGGAELSQVKGPNVENSVAVALHEQTTGMLVPFGNLSREDGLKRLLVVRVCRRISEAALGLSSPSLSPSSSEKITREVESETRTQARVREESEIGTAITPIPVTTAKDRIGKISKGVDADQNKGERTPEEVVEEEEEGGGVESSDIKNSALNLSPGDKVQDFSTHQVDDEDNGEQIKAPEKGSGREEGILKDGSFSAPHEEDGVGELGSLIAELVASGDSLRMQAGTPGTEQGSAGGREEEGELLTEAARAYTEVLRVDPSNVPALFGLGCVHNGQHRFADAATSLRAALDVNEGDDPGNFIHDALELALAGARGVSPPLETKAAAAAAATEGRYLEAGSESPLHLQSPYGALAVAATEVLAGPAIVEPHRFETPAVAAQQRRGGRSTAIAVPRGSTPSLAAQGGLAMSSDQGSFEVEKEVRSQSQQQAAGLEGRRAEVVETEAETSEVRQDFFSAGQPPARETWPVAVAAKDHSRWGEVYLLGNSDAPSSWKRDSRSFLEETFGFVRCRDFAEFEHDSTEFPAGPVLGGAVGAKPAVVSSSRDPRLILSYISAAGPCAAALVDTAALVAEGRTVVVVLEASPSAATKGGVVQDVDSARSSLKSLAARFSPGSGKGNTVVVRDILEAQFKVIDLLSPVHNDGGVDNKGTSSLTSSSQPVVSVAAAGGRASSSSLKKANSGLNLDTRAVSAGTDTDGTDECSRPAARGSLNELVRKATEAALRSMQKQHEEDMQAAMVAHEQQLRITAKQLQNEALLSERRYFRGVPTDALWQTSEDRVELVVKERETSLLRAKRAEFTRAMAHRWLTRHRLGLAHSFNAWRRSAHFAVLNQVVKELLKQHQRASGAARLICLGGLTRIRQNSDVHRLRGGFGQWQLVCSASKNVAALGESLQSAQHDARQTAKLAQEHNASLQRLVKENARVVGVLEHGRDKHASRVTALQEEVSELNAELEELYDRHGHIKRQLLVLRHSRQNSRP